jgi:hypothetical protein
MDCRDATRQFSDLYDGLLRGEEVAELDRHLVTCARCRQEWIDFQKTVEAVRNLGAAEPSPGFAAHVRAMIETPPWYRRLGRWLFVPWQIKVPIEVATAVLLAIGSVLIYDRQPEMRRAVERPELRQVPVEAKRGDATRRGGVALLEKRRAMELRPFGEPLARLPERPAGEPLPLAKLKAEKPGEPSPREESPASERSVLSPLSGPPEATPPARQEMSPPAPAPAKPEDRVAEPRELARAPDVVAAPARPAPGPPPTPLRIMTLRVPRVAVAEARIREWTRQVGGRVLDAPAIPESTGSGQRNLSLMVPLEALPRLDALLAELGQVFGRETEAPRASEVLISLTISPKSPSPSPAVE